MFAFLSVRFFAFVVDFVKRVCRKKKKKKKKEKCSGGTVRGTAKSSTVGPHVGKSEWPLLVTQVP